MLTLALLFAALSLAVGCRPRPLTEQQVCDQLVPAVCEYRIRCGTWASTQSDCELVEGQECCSGDFCDLSAGNTQEELRLCAAGIRGSVCTAEGPTISPACPSRIGGSDAVDAGP
jgi:hypothetical protein